MRKHQLAGLGWVRYVAAGMARLGEIWADNSVQPLLARWLSGANALVGAVCSGQARMARRGEL